MIVQFSASETIQLITHEEFLFTTEGVILNESMTGKEGPEDPEPPEDLEAQVGNGAAAE